MPQTAVHHEVNDQRPGVLEKFVGQKSVVDRIKVALEAAWNDTTRLPHMLFVGGSGLGKTQLCEVIAHEMGCELRQQLAQNLNHPSALHGFLIEGESRGVQLIDEIHQLANAAQTLLYRAIEERQLFLGCTPFRDTPQIIPLEDFTLLAATTEQYSLLPPLLDRFKIVAHFSKYSPEELVQLLDQRCQMLRWSVQAEVLKLIAERGRGVPRRSLRLLESVHRTARANAADTMTIAHFERTCQLERMDRAGLDELERRYLSLLYAAQGCLRLNVLAARLGLPDQTIQRIVERQLLEEGFIEKLSDGQRVLTEKGLKHLQIDAD